MENVIIIGSGPAGLTAAIYAARANLKPLVIEGVIAGGQTGGQLMITTDVENFPGFPDGVKGPEVIELMHRQAERFGTRFVLADVDKIQLSGGSPFTLEADGTTYQTHTVIISTGASARWLGLESETELRNRGVSACATCDGFFFKDQDVSVVGGGDTALEEALFLAGICKSVTLIHRREELRASKIMQARAMRHPKIKFLWNHEVTEVLGVKEGAVSALKVQNTKTKETHVHATQGLFVAIGHVPNTQLFAGQLTLDENKYIKTVPGSTATNVPGVFACGDVQDHQWRQAITAAGTGCMSAIEAERWLGAKELI
ncbi:MAG TPA: thioredoxin-disulfide reductase [Polyangiales bacterium]|nr:thioredoxin-disulfide reductase [Polyangiales bacterium]